MLRRLLLVAATFALAIGLTAVVPPSPAAAYDNSIGVVKVPEQIRKSGCADYLMRWGFTPPSPDWTVIAEVRNPNGKAVLSQFWDAGSPNNLGRVRGNLKFQLCGASAPVGRYSISMQMIYTEGRQRFTAYRAPTYFKLVQRR